MPNHCEADLYIEGPANKIKEFIEFAKGSSHRKAVVSPLQVNKFIPYPQKFIDLDIAYDNKIKELDAMSEEDRKAYIDKYGFPKDGYNQGGYDWCCNNWGTKWGFYNTDMEPYKEGDDNVTYHTMTAWSAPVPVIQKMIEMFPDLSFCYEYYEGGMGFQGSICGKGGEVTVDESHEYDGYRGG